MRTVLFFAWPQFDAPETAFWRRLRDALQGLGLRLVLATDSTPPADLGVDHVRVPRRLDATWPCGGSPFGGPLSRELGLETAALLERESAWGEPGLVPAVDAMRVRGIDGVAAYWGAVLAWLRPVVTVIWNGQHTPEMVLASLCRAGGCPVLIAERAPVPRALFVDDIGLSSASAVASRPDWTTADPERWAAVADRVTRRLATGGFTWWEQPARSGLIDLRTQLGVPTGTRVVLFAGQVDEDTQQFLFSPHFASNLAAFSWWLEHVRGREDIFVLGKHHPKSTVSPAAYRRVLAASGLPGVWIDDVNIDDALAAADRVVLVNSTVAYEALARRVPVLVLGQWLIGGRGAAYELVYLDDADDLIDRWIHDRDAVSQAGAWTMALAYLLENALYAYEPAPVTGGMHAADDLARRLEERGRHSPGWTAPEALIAASLRVGPESREPWWMPWDAEWTIRLHERMTADAVEWQRWQWMRETIKRARAAVREGRRLVVWGTGEAGRHVGVLLRGVGVEADAFGSSAAMPGVTFLGRPVLSPADLVVDGSGASDYVLIATAARDEVAAWLETRGLTTPRDYDAFEIDDVLAAARTHHHETFRRANAAGGERGRD